MKIWHKICIALGVLVLLAVSAWVWDLWTWKRGAELTLADTQREANAAQAQVEAVKKELNEATTTITLLQKRRTGEQVVLRDVPADCQECFRLHKISIQDGNSLWTYSNSDVIGQVKGTLTLSDAFWQETTEPYKKAQEDCQKRLGEALGKPKSLFRHGSWLEARAGYGISGMEAEVGSWPLEIGGRRFSLQVGAFTRAALAPDGLLTGQAAAGVKVLIR